MEYSRVIKSILFFFISLSIFYTAYGQDKDPYYKEGGKYFGLPFSHKKSSWWDKMTGGSENDSLIIGGYIDTYFDYYSDHVQKGVYEDFTIVSPMSKEFSINVAEAYIRYSNEKVRSNLSLIWGDVPIVTWDNKFNWIFEANVGIRLHPKVWLDIGFFPAVIGTESMLPKYNMMSSISYINYCYPSVSDGAILSWNPSEKIETKFILSNSRSTFINTDTSKSIAMGINIISHFNDHTKLSYCNKFDLETNELNNKDGIWSVHNLFLDHEKNKLHTIIGVDFGLFDNVKTDMYTFNTTFMYSGLAYLKYQIRPKFGIYGRLEYFSDKHGVVSNTITSPFGVSNGVELAASTFGLEFRPIKSSYIRLETREEKLLNQTPYYFTNSDGTQNSFRWSIMFTFGLDISSSNLLKNK